MQHKKAIIIGGSALLAIAIIVVAFIVYRNKKKLKAAAIEDEGRISEYVVPGSGGDTALNFDTGAQAAELFFSLGRGITLTEVEQSPYAAQSPGGSAQDVANGIACLINVLPSTQAQNAAISTAAQFANVGGSLGAISLQPLSTTPTASMQSIFSNMAGKLVNDTADILALRVRNPGNLPTQINNLRNTRTVTNYEAFARDAIGVYNAVLMQVISDTEASFRDYVNQFDRAGTTSSAGDSIYLPLSDDTTSPMYLLTRFKNGGGPLGSDEHTLSIVGEDGRRSPDVWRRLHGKAGKLALAMQYRIDNYSSLNGDAVNNAHILRDIVDNYMKTLAYLFAPSNFTPSDGSEFGAFSAVLRVVGTVVPILAPVTALMGGLVAAETSRYNEQGLSSANSYNSSLSGWALSRGY